MAYKIGIHSGMKFLNRLLKLPENRHFFLFGARNIGKSTLLRKSFKANNPYWIDLLDADQEDKYVREPMRLQAEVLALKADQKLVIIDEIQKLPKLLDVVHKLIESTDKIFIMTGSSARKLKHGGANLLAGRAFVYNLFPFVAFELGEHFDLDDALRYGTLPTIYALDDDADKIRFLQAYAQTYLKEEIWLEHLIRKLEPFRKFLEVAAQSNGKIINYSNIARDVGVDDKTIKEYFSLLEDTLIGFYLEPFNHSFRKRLSAKPKFYFFDTGVVRALARLLTVPLVSGTSAYGEVFEHYVILECMRLASYSKPEYRLSYLKTKDDAEVDLIIERPGEKLLFIEIKSSSDISEIDISSFSRLVNDFGECQAICLSKDPVRKIFGNIEAMYWKEGLRQIFDFKD